MNARAALLCLVGAWLAIQSVAPAACISDTDGDGVCDNVDLCPNTVPYAPVDSVGCPALIPGDDDRDGDVDLDDLAAFSACRTGATVSATAACRQDFDFDLDQDVDMDDYGGFQRCFSGANVPASANCGTHSAEIVNGCLQIIGTGAGTQLALRLQAGTPTILQVDIGNDGYADFVFGRSDFNCIVVNAGGGDDTILIDELNGVFTDTEATTLRGGIGNDSLTGGSGSETFEGGPGNDVVFMGGGDDRFIWNPGDNTDLIEGDAGTDTVEVNGGDVDEDFTTTANGTRVRFDRLNPAPFALDINACEKLVVNANGGEDTFSATGNLAALIQITVDGGDGNDTIRGSNGTDLLLGGDGADFIDGQQGNDTALMGAGDDVFQWDPGDGSDTVEGQGDTDTLLFNGSNGGENFDVAPNGKRVRFTRNLGSIVMDLGDVEALDLNALGGIDVLTVNDLSGTGMVELNVSLAGALGGASGDGALDTVIFNGTAGNDILLAALQGGNVVVNNLSANVTISHFDATDSIQFLGLGNHDVIDASAVVAGGPSISMDGGSGDDILVGSAGADVLKGGDGDDVLLGSTGVDVLEGGLNENVVLQDGISPTASVVTIFGDDADNTITISRNAGGQLLSNGVVIPGATVANTARIRVFGRDGNDTLVLDESQGALPAAVLYAGAGNDTAVGGSNADLLFGGVDNDTLLGKGGLDFLFGGNGNDTLTGGDAEDQAFGETGDDRMVWNPGDDTDLNEGGAGIDTVEVNGGNGAEQFTTTANGARVRFDRLDPAPFSIDIGTSENLVLNANGGNDSFSATGNLAVLIKITVDGGAGDDTILGSNGADLLIGGDNNDFIDGQQGSDTALLGAGDDVFQWDPGDGSDTVEGQAGADTLLFNGSGGAEIFDVSSNGARVRFTRNLGNIVMDLDDVESIDLNTLGNTDTTTVNNLSGTDLIELNINLAGTIGGTTGDGLADVVIVNGTNGNDMIDVFGAGTSVAVTGLPTRVNITDSEGANDSLVINTMGGNDGVTATTLPAGVIKLTIDGGANDDTLLGSQGADVLLGGDHDDFIFGDNGNDVALMGAGNDVFQWDPGDGSDTLEGQAGTDTMRFFGSNGGENIDIFANGGRVLFFRNVGNVTMDLDDVETIEFRALGGVDNIVIGDLSGTDATQVTLDLRGPNGGGDSTADTVTVNGTQGADVFGATGDAGGVRVFGLHTDVNILFQEQANDRLTLNGLGEDDIVDATSLEADGIQLAMNGGLGADVLLGSDGDDLINGGDGDDVVLMGAGNDTFVWNPGDDNDTLEGQSGADIMLFNGSNAAESITISANGGRVIFFRDVASVTMDLNDLERIDYNALGGADNIVVHNLAGTDAAEINVNLASANGTGDAAADSITVNGTANADVIGITANTGIVQVAGLAAVVRISGAEPTLDRLTVNGLAGIDLISTGPGVTSLILLTVNP